MSSLDEYASAKLGELEDRGLRRHLYATDRFSDIHVRRAGREMISFCCNDYLNLSHHPDVIAAANAATERYGTGSGGSRLISGNTPPLEELEAKLAAFKGTESAMVFGSGYLANIGIIPCVAGPGDLILMDELNHACLHGGAQLSRADVKPYRHVDMDHLDALLKEHRSAFNHCLIVSDGVFSMDGNIAPIVRLAALANEHDAWLMTDDAHGLGVLADGRGSGIVSGTHADIPLQMGTLSKSIGAYGGYLCASRPVIDLVRNRARSFVYSTGLPPAMAAASIAALELIEQDPALCARPVENAGHFCSALNLRAPETPIVPLILGEAERVMRASSALEDRGYLVTGIRPPTVPEGTARLRFTFTAQHTTREIDGLVSTIRDLDLAA
ncbi:MAG: 8-amino-7-oxononanoate synthase [Alphaproteobacteria bacterium]